MEGVLAYAKFDSKTAKLNLETETVDLATAVFNLAFANFTEKNIFPFPFTLNGI